MKVLHLQKIICMILFFFDNHSVDAILYSIFVLNIIYLFLIFNLSILLLYKLFSKSTLELKFIDKIILCKI
jgi:hypothetical protein